MSSLYEQAGGAPGVLRLTTALHTRCLADEVLEHPFGHDGNNPEHVARLAAYLGEVLGGPPRFTAAMGDHSAMLELHAHQGMDADLGDRFLACFLAALDDAKLPQNSGFRTTMHDYMRAACDEVMRYDDPASVVPAGLPMPQA